MQIVELKVIGVWQPKLPTFRLELSHFYQVRDTDIR